MLASADRVTLKRAKKNSGKPAFLGFSIVSLPTSLYRCYRYYTSRWLVWPLYLAVWVDLLIVLFEKPAYEDMLAPYWVCPAFSS
eukprot:m.123911 g.123911  ORF g.123911 m.123911 type:complete len:84 (+) comp37843_c0_seq9:895-1146(+)